MTENSLSEQTELPKDDKPLTFKWVAEYLYRHPNTGKYYALVKKNGKQIRRSLKTTERQLAGRRLTDLRAKLGLGTNSTKPRGITFMALAKDWFEVHKTRLKPTSARGLAVSIRQLNKHFGTMAVRSITTADCREWEKKRGAYIGASSFNHELTALVAVLNDALKASLLRDNPALTIPQRKLPKNKMVIPTEDQLAQLVKTPRCGCQDPTSC